MLGPHIAKLYYYKAKLDIYNAAGVPLSAEEIEEIERAIDAADKARRAGVLFWSVTIAALLVPIILLVIRLLV